MRYLFTIERVQRKLRRDVECSAYCVAAVRWRPCLPRSPFRAGLAGTKLLTYYVGVFPRGPGVGGLCRTGAPHASLHCPMAAPPTPGAARSSGKDRDGRLSDKCRCLPAASTCVSARLPLRLAPDVSVRVGTEIVGGRKGSKIAHNLHRFCAPCGCMPVRLNLDLAPAARIDETVTRRLASKARKVRHGISHGAFVRNIRHQ